jgi:hypothetical protein
MKTFLYCAALTLAGLSASSFADQKSCGTGKFTCNVEKNQSSTCCASAETCTTNTKGQAACTIPSKERTPTASSTKAAAPVAKPKK